MKYLLGLLLICVSSSYAQFGASAVKMGYFSPAAAEGGFIIGYEGVKEVDKAFFYGWSIDWFHKSYVDKTLIDNISPTFGSGQINELRAKTNINDFPLMFTAGGKFPIGSRAYMYLNGGVGVELLLVNFRNFEEPDNDEFRAAFDFNWRVGMGAAYGLGGRSELFGEITYHHSEPSWEFEVDNPVGGKRTFERTFDMSGVMARIGFRFYY